ncbi:MAG: hypothetical protein KDD50_03960 [Bdellovibrionales bacterium]|nr:hypothetical protein [Bdellovibrionales bacterium]
MNKIFYLILSCVFIFHHSVRADDFEQSYDSIIEELSQTSRTRVSSVGPRDPFANILFHAGVNFATSHINLHLPQDVILSGFHNGVEFSFGIDLFSKNWVAEGSIRSYGDASLKGSTVSLKEFDLKILNRSHLTRTLVFNTSFGLGARYIDVLYSPKADQNVGVSAEQDNTATYEYKTPASVLSFGLHAYFTEALSVGADLSYRSSLISESADKNSIDIALKIDTHF